MAETGTWIAQLGFAVAGIVTAIGGVLATRGRTRSEENAQLRETEKRLRARVEKLQHDRDAAVDYVYELRGRLHQAGVDPPPWPDGAPPPWNEDDRGRS